MTSTVITTWQELDRLKDEWNNLLVSSRSNTIFLTWEWVQAWRNAAGKDADLFVIEVRDSQNELIGIAPFYRYTIRLHNLITFKALRVLADYATGSEYADWIVHPNHESRALNEIADKLARTSGWDLIWMPRVSGWNDAHERLTKALEHNGLLFHTRQSEFSALALPETLQSYEESFSSKRRQQMRRNKRNLFKDKDIEIVFCESADNLANFIDALFDLHHQRRMLLDDPGCFKRKPAEAAFYREFLPVALDRGWLRFAALTKHGNIQTIQIGYAYNNDFLQMQEGFNPDFEKGSGNVLRHRVIEECIHEGLSSYDFLGGFTEHKRRWGAQLRHGHDILVGRPCIKNRLFFLQEIWPSGKHLTEVGLYDGN